MRRLRAAALVVLLATPAVGQDAAKLFEEGLVAFQRGDTAVACVKFEQSYKLDAATGTLFNLATCHAKEASYWRARAEFLQLAEDMDRAGKWDKADIAREQASAAETHLPHLVFNFTEASNVRSIQIDGDELDASKWHEPYPVAPGSHVVAFDAEGMQSESSTIDAEGDGTVVAVAVPALKNASALLPAPSDALARRPPAPPAADTLHDNPYPSRRRSAPSAPTAEPTDATWGYASIAGGAGLVVIGGIAGTMVYGKKAIIDDHCNAAKACDSEGLDAVSSARALSTVSTVAVALGAVAVGAGVYVVLSSDHDAHDQPAVGAWTIRGGAATGLRGAF